MTFFIVLLSNFSFRVKISTFVDNAFPVIHQKAVTHGFAHV
jgi:hypothetical protein